jgi:dCTP deaminase
MILSDKAILAALCEKKLIIHPILSVSQIHGCKVDVRLSNTLHLIGHVRKSFYDPAETESKNIGEIVTVPFEKGRGFTLQPGEFATAPLFESVRLPPYLKGTLDGRSSLGRLGIGVHVTAGTIDPGFSGQLTCELVNLGKIPVKLYPLQRVGSIMIEELDQAARFAYSGQLGKKYGHAIETRLSTDYEFSKELIPGSGDGKPSSIIERIQTSL